MSLVDMVNLEDGKEYFLQLQAEAFNRMWKIAWFNRSINDSMNASHAQIRFKKHRNIAIPLNLVENIAF